MRNSNGQSIRRRFISSKKLYIFPNWSKRSWKYQSISSRLFVSDKEEAVSEVIEFMVIVDDVSCTD